MIYLNSILHHFELLVDPRMCLLAHAKFLYDNIPSFKYTYQYSRGNALQNADSNHNVDVLRSKLDSGMDIESRDKVRPGTCCVVRGRLTNNIDHSRVIVAHYGLVHKAFVCGQQSGGRQTHRTSRQAD